MVFSNNLLMGAAGQASGYDIDQSIRFNDGDSAYLEKTYDSSESTLRVWSFSVWTKRSKLGAEQWLFTAGTAASNLEYLRFTSGDTLEYKLFLSSSLDANYITSQLFRDSSAWMHIYAYRSSTTFKLYINGSEVTDFSTSNAPGSSGGMFGKNVRHRIGADYATPSNFLGAYLAEINFVSGTAKSVTDFGETNNEGIWIPKKYDGAYGDNGFFIDGRDSSDLGSDESGNGNDFTSSGLTTADQVSDSPTNNFCVLNPLDPATTGTLSDGNLVTSGDAKATIRPSSGQWYYEKDGVGVSYNADTSGIFNPTLAAGTYNFGQSAFSDTGPTGSEKVISTANLPSPSITDGSKYFQSTLYTGTGSSLAVTQSGNSTFQPDWVWIKGRSGATEHVLTDAVRGVTKELSSDDNGAEETVAQGLTAFGSSGFTVGTDGSYNTGSATYVGWQWKANGSGSSNEDGDITSTVSANTTAGFSIVKYSGNGSDNQEIGHGLGIAPKMIITKRRDASGNWTTYNDAVGVNKVFYLNSTAAPVSNTEQYRAVPTSSVYTVGVGGDINNASGTYVAYCFAEIPGYSSIGSYTGNGSTDGPFVYTGFTPRYVLFKRINAAESWPILDTARGSGNFGADAGTGGDNPTAANDLNAVLVASTAAAEEDNSAGSRKASFNSNGFKVRTTNTAMNSSGSTYIYMAFAEHPFGGDGVAPATAR